MSNAPAARDLSFMATATVCLLASTAGAHDGKPSTDRK
jgi:hypothetical protein